MSEASKVIWWLVLSFQHKALKTEVTPRSNNCDPESLGLHPKACTREYISPVSSPRQRLNNCDSSAWSLCLHLILSFMELSREEFLKKFKWISIYILSLYRHKRLESCYLLFLRTSFRGTQAFLVMETNTKMVFRILYRKQIENRIWAVPTFIHL